MPYKVLKTLLISGGSRLEPGQVLNLGDLPFPVEQVRSLIEIDALVEEVEVPSGPPAPPLPSDEVEPDLVNVNKASEVDLTDLPAIGKAIAQRIIKGRPYQSLDEVAQVSGLKPDQWSQVVSLLTV